MNSNVISFEGQTLRFDKPDDIKNVIEEVKKNKSAQIINLSGNTLGVSAAEELGKNLDECSNLSVCRSKQEISPALTFVSSGIMRAEAKLVELDLCDNAFGPNGVTGVTELLASPVCYTLKYLKMHNQGLGHKGCDYLVEALKKGREASDGKGLQLEVFYAGRNRLENYGIGLLADFFSDIKSLKEIAVYQNGIGIHGPAGVQHLAKIVKSNKNLEMIDFSDNTITSDGFEYILPVFKKVPSLKVLKLDDCILKSAGIKRLAQQFDNEDFLPALEQLFLCGNEISTSAMTKLILGLSNLPNLNHLSIKANCFGSSGIEKIIQILDSVDLLPILFSPEQYRDSLIDDIEKVKEYAFSDDESNDEESEEEEEYDDSYGSDDENDYSDEETSHLQQSSIHTSDEQTSGIQQTPEKPNETFSFQKVATSLKLPTTPSGGLFSSPFLAQTQQSVNGGSGGGGGGLFGKSFLSMTPIVTGKLLNYLLSRDPLTLDYLNQFKNEFTKQDIVIDVTAAAKDMSKYNPETVAHCSMHLLDDKQVNKNSSAYKTCMNILTAALGHDDKALPSFSSHSLNAILVHVGAVKPEMGNLGLKVIVEQAQPFKAIHFDLLHNLVSVPKSNIPDSVYKTLYYILQKERKSMPSKDSVTDVLDNTINLLNSKMTSLTIS